MNYYNPYFGGIPYTSMLNDVTTTSTSQGILSRLFNGKKISSFINGTQKTLNIINQAIPLVKQATPVMKNAKTMFKVMNEFKRIDNTRQTLSAAPNPEISTNSNSDTNEVTNPSNNQPKFFL